MGKNRYKWSCSISYVKLPEGITFFICIHLPPQKTIKKPSWNLSEGCFLGECEKHRTQHFAAVFNGSNPRKIHIEGLFLMEHPAAQLHAPKLEISFYSMCTYICTKKNIGPSNQHFIYPGGLEHLDYLSISYMG